MGPIRTEYCHIYRIHISHSIIGTFVRIGGRLYTFIYLPTYLPTYLPNPPFPPFSNDSCRFHEISRHVRHHQHPMKCHITHHASNTTLYRRMKDQNIYRHPHPHPRLTVAPRISPSPRHMVGIYAASNQHGRHPCPCSCYCYCYCLSPLLPTPPSRRRRTLLLPAALSSSS